MEQFENFTEMWEEKGEMLKEIGCTERAAHAIWAWGIECGRAKNLQQAHVIKSLLADLPENRPLYKDSGLWQMRSDDMEEVLIQQGVNETDIEFLARCKASNVL